MSKKAIVTGHSKGLGKALAEQLEAAGWSVLGVSRSAGAQVDLSSPDALMSWLDGGELASFLSDASDILLINNAGAVAPINYVGEQDATATVAAVNLNVTAPLLLTDAVVRHRVDGAQVRVVHISSGAARHAYETWSVYCTTKAAVDMHAVALDADQLDGVRVASIAPGVVDTEMQGMIRSADFPMRDRFQAMKERGDLASPEEAAAKLLALVERDDFGSKVIADIRD